MKRLNVLTIIACTLLITLAACSDSTENVESICGAVQDGEKLTSKIEIESGDYVQITAYPAHNQLSLRDGKEPLTAFARRIKLQGISDLSEPDRTVQAITIMRSLGEFGYFIRADDECDELVNDNLVIPGQVFTEDGRSFAEELLLAGVVDVERGGACKAELIENCFSALSTEAAR